MKVEKDRYNGIVIKTEDQNFGSIEEFKKELHDNIIVWKQSGVRGLWIQISLADSHLVPICTELGFDFHHAQPGYVMMAQWLAENEPNLLPEYANQYIGVSGFVVNDKNQVLAVKERFSSGNFWKLPGGHADKGEDIGDTARREVFEETGIECEFQALVCFRHHHKYRHGCSDLYFICLMKPTSFEIKRCEHEIADCKWIDIDEYINHPTITPANKHFAQCCKDALENNQAILPQDVLMWTKKGFDKVYSVNNFIS